MVNGSGGESDQALEIVTGSDELGDWDDGITIDENDFPWHDVSAMCPMDIIDEPLGTEGQDWDMLWISETFDPKNPLFEIAASPAIGDVDNDGDFEVVIGSSNGYLYVLDGASGEIEMSFDTESQIYASAALANLDRDIYLEMVVGPTDGNLHCFQWDGSLGSTEWQFPTGGAVYSSAAVGDVDGDGSLEVVVVQMMGRFTASVLKEILNSSLLLAVLYLSKPNNSIRSDSVVAVGSLVHFFYLA